jgi:hypothetical protein
MHPKLIAASMGSIWLLAAFASFPNALVFITAGYGLHNCRFQNR